MSAVRADQCGQRDIQASARGGPATAHGSGESILINAAHAIAPAAGAIQEQKVARITQQLDEVRKQIAGETPSYRPPIAPVQDRQDISAETDAHRRKQLEDMRAGLKMVAGNGPDRNWRHAKARSPTH